MLGDQKFEQETSVHRVANFYTDIQPIPWTIGKVKTLAEGNQIVGFYLAEGSGIHLSQIPDEIFNHQLKEVDCESVDDLCLFMQQYGILFDSWPGAINEMAQYNKFINIKKWGVPSKADIDAIQTQMKHFLGVGASRTQGRAQTRELWLAELDNMRVHSQAHWEAFAPKLFLTSYEEIKENIALIFELVNLAMAAAQTTNEGELAHLIGIDRDGLFDEILYLDQTLNGLLHVFSPKVGFQYVSDKLVGEPTYYCDLLDIHEADGALSASLMNAIALQIRDFNLHLQDAHRCIECGTLFVKKQAERKSNRAHIDSKFCCDKCKNRYTQRRHRLSKTSSHSLSIT